MKRTLAEIKQGQTVVFTVVPNGSYLHTGEQYLAESVEKRSIYFRNVVRNCGTSDPRCMTAEYEVIG